ncbi:putative ribonuclease H-like domain-containing protein [Tanacetum coccineum]
MTHPSPKRNMVPKAVLMKSGLVSLTTARPVNTAQPRTTINSARPMKNVFNKAHSTVRRPINNKIATKNSNFSKRVNTVSGKNVNIARPKEVVNAARPKAVLNAVKGNQVNAVKASSCWAWKPQRRESHKKSVLFNDTEYIVLSPNFMLTDESHVLLKVPIQNNMYSVDLKNIIPKGGITCLFAKATSDETELWHRRVGHINFKTMNKLDKGNLVRGLPSKIFENDQTCVACQKGKQHRASKDPRAQRKHKAILSLGLSWCPLKIVTAIDLNGGFLDCQLGIPMWGVGFVIVKVLDRCGEVNEVDIDRMWGLESSVLSNNVADEVVNEEMDDSLVRAATTASGLEAEQDSGNGQVVVPSARRSYQTSKCLRDEDRLKLNELMEFCTKLQQRVLDLENTKTAQAQEITSLKLRVWSDQEDSSKQGRKIDDIDKDAEITLVDETQGRYGDDLMFDTGVLDDEEVFAGQVMAEKEINVAEKEVSIADPVTTADEVVTIATVEISTTSPTETIIVNDLTLSQTLIEIRVSKPKSKIWDTGIGGRKFVKRYSAEGVRKELSRRIKDLENLYKLIKAKYGSTRPVEDLDLVLYGDLKIMFEPHVKDNVWKNQSDCRVLDWKLYDSCGGHSFK